MTETTTLPVDDENGAIGAVHEVRTEYVSPGVLHDSSGTVTADDLTYISNLLRSQKPQTHWVIPPKEVNLYAHIHGGEAFDKFMADGIADGTIKEPVQ